MTDSVISEDDIARAANEPPARVEAPPQVEQRQEPTPGHQEGSPPEGAQQRPPVMVPVGEVQEQRNRRKEIQKERDNLIRENAEFKGRLAALEQLYGRQAQPQTQPQTPADIPDMWTDPNGFVRHEAAAILDERAKPFAEQQRRMQQALDFNNRMTAEGRYTPEAVKAAEEWFNLAVAKGEFDPNEHRRINSSPNPYAAAVEAHKRSQVLLKVGDDPEQWFDKTFEERLRSDPERQAKALALLQGMAQQNEASGRSAPVFTGLPSVNGAAGASARGPTTITEEDILNAAPQRMGRR